MRSGCGVKQGADGGSDGGRTGDWTGGSNGGRTGQSDGGSDRGWMWDQIGGSDVGRTGGRTRDRMRWGGRTRWLVNFSQEVLQFADKSSNVDVLHPTCPSLGKVNFGLGKITLRSVTIMAEARRTS